MLAALALSALWLRRPYAVAESVRQGLTLCAKTMIPSLFPFMVLSELLVQSSGEIGRLPARILRPIFGVSGAGACALTLGWLCGFPVGARAAAACYREGRMSERELCYVLCFCNVPSAAFLVGVVGSALLGSQALGVALTVLTLLSAVLTGLLFRPIFLGRGKADRSDARDLAPPVAAGGGLSDAIRQGAMSMLQVCATVIVFCAIVGTLCQYADALGLSSVVRAALFGIFELSTGAREAASLTDVRVAAVVAAGVCGWGGLCVHCQILSVCDGCPVCPRWFFAARMIQALICGAGMAFIVYGGVV